MRAVAAAVLLIGCLLAAATASAATLNPPAGTSAIAASETRIGVSWRDTSVGESGFELHRSTGGPGGAFIFLAVTGAQATVYSDTALDPATPYCYRVRAFRSAAGRTTYSAFSITACAATPALPAPAAPSLARAEPMTYERIDVYWQDNSINEAGFEMHRAGRPDGVFTLAAALPAGAIARVDGGLTPSTQYCYKVRAFAKAGTATAFSAFSSTACATTPPQPPPPPSIHLTTATTGVDPDADGYRVDIRTYDGPWGSSLGVTAATLPANGTVTISGLSPRDYELRFTGMAANCDVQGPAIRVVTVGGWWNPPVPVQFDVTCTPVKQLAFADSTDGNSDIYLINANGTGGSRLTLHPALDAEPAWSPDGSRIAFRSDRDGSAEIYVMNADGSNPVRVTYLPGGNFRPAWSPDGGRIGFTNYRDGPGEIYVVNVDGSGLANLTNHSADDAAPSWSPDGTRIAFQSDRGLGSPYTAIYVMNADGSAVTRLSTDLWPLDSQPAWSPDGTRLAIVHAFEVQTISIMSVADGSAMSITGVSNECQRHNDPVWSPDGLKLAFTQSDWCSLDSAVHIQRVSGPEELSGGVRITPGSNPSWRR